MLIDVRTPDEHRTGHKPGSINIPLAAIRSFCVPEKNTPIRVYCKSGGRASQAKEILESMGYTDVTNIGGFDK